MSYSSYTLHHLIIQAKNLDDDAFSMLFNQYLPIVYKLKQKYFVYEWEDEDWLQEAQFIFYKTLKNYEFSDPYSLGCQFKVSFKSHIFNTLKHLHTFKYISWKQTQYISDMNYLTYTSLITNYNPCEEVILKESIISILNTLSLREKIMLFREIYTPPHQKIDPINGNFYAKYSLHKKFHQKLLPKKSLPQKNHNQEKPR